jgi:hypothetical protein
LLGVRLPVFSLLCGLMNAANPGVSGISFRFPVIEITVAAHFAFEAFDNSPQPSKRVGRTARSIVCPYWNFLTHNSRRQGVWLHVACFTRFALRKSGRVLAHVLRPIVHPAHFVLSHVHFSLQPRAWHRRIGGTLSAFRGESISSILALPHALPRYLPIQ